MSKRKSFVINKNLTAGLTQTMEAAKNHASELRYEVVPIHLIEPDPENPRDLALSFSDLLEGPKKGDVLYEKKMKEIEDLESLSASIKKEGVINAVIVYKHMNKYRLVAGERRCLASLHAGKKDIYARIIDKKPERLREGFIQWIENSERSDLSLWERLRNIRKIIEGYQTEVNPSANINGSLLADLLGCSPAVAGNYVSILNTPEKIQSAIKEEKINNVEKAAFLSRLKEGDIQDAVFDACVKGENIKNMKNLSVTLEKQKKILSNIKTTTTNKAGRKVTKITLGHTKDPNIVKTIINLFLENTQYAQLRDRFLGFDLNDFSGASKAFSVLIEYLEAG